MDAFYRKTLAGVLALLVLLAAIVVAMRVATPEVTREEVRRAVVATIQREAPASFYVTGELEVMTTATVENTKTFLPDVLDLDLGTTRTTVRMPGRLSYGFDVRRLEPEMIDVGEDGVVTVVLPDLEVYAAEPNLERMEVRTDVGWARLSASSGRRVERQAIGLIQRTLREQGAAHLESSTQPRVNTAAALERLLRPVLEAAGMDEPRFRFRIGPELVMEPEG